MRAHTAVGSGFLAGVALGAGVALALGVVTGRSFFVFTVSSPGRDVRRVARAASSVPSADAEGDDSLAAFGSAFGFAFGASEPT